MSRKKFPRYPAEIDVKPRSLKVDLSLISKRSTAGSLTVYNWAYKLQRYKILQIIDTFTDAVIMPCCRYN